MVGRRAKIAIIGAGQIGGTAALLMGKKDLGDVILTDIVPKMPIGKALDLNQMASVQGSSNKYQGTNDYKDIAGSDVVVVIAGMPRKPGMSRDDLIAVNAKVMAEVGGHIRTNAPNAFVVVITNPLDVMVQCMHTATGFPHNRVVGMAGILDSSRFKQFLAEKLEVSVKDVQTIVLGGHGDTMVPVPRFTSVSGIPLEQWIAMGKITQQEVDELVKRTVGGGGEIVNLMGTSAFTAPAAAAAEMVEAYLRDQKRVLPCAAFLTGQYGVTGHYIGVPVIIGAGGVEKIIELKLTADEIALFDKSAQAVIQLQKAVPQ